MTGESEAARDLLVGLEPSELDTAPRLGAPSAATMAALVRALLAPHGPLQMMEDARFAAGIEEAGRSPWHAVALSLVGAGDLAQRGRRGGRGAVPGGDPRLRGAARRGRPRRTRRPVAARRRPRRVGGGPRVRRGGRAADRPLRGRRLPAQLGGADRARQAHGARGRRRRDRRPHGHAAVLGPRLLPLDPAERAGCASRRPSSTAASSSRPGNSSTRPKPASGDGPRRPGCSGGPRRSRSGCAPARRSSRSRERSCGCSSSCRPT